MSSPTVFATLRRAFRHHLSLRGLEPVALVWARSMRLHAAVPAVLRGPRSPLWGCRCGEPSNWACRVRCRGCDAAGPRRVFTAAKAAATARTGCGDLVGARYLSFRWAGPLPRWLRWLSVFGVGRDARHLLHKRDGVDAALAYDDSGTRLVVALLVVVAVDDPWAVVLGSGDWEWGWGVAGW